MAFPKCLGSEGMAIFGHFWVVMVTISCYDITGLRLISLYTENINQMGPDPNKNKSYWKVK